MFWNEKCVCSNDNSKQLLFNDAFQKAWKRRTRTIIVKSSAGDRKPKLEEISLLTTSRSSVWYGLLESSDDLNNNVIRLRSLRTTLLLVHVYFVTCYKILRDENISFKNLKTISDH